MSESPDGLPPRSGVFAMLEACCHAMLSDVAGVAGSEMTPADGAIEAEQAMDILHKAIAAGYRAPALRTEAALDPLRTRADFQLLIMDVAFPADPFARRD